MIARCVFPWPNIDVLGAVGITIEKTMPQELFHVRLKQARELRELTQEQLEEKTGLGSTIISHFESGRRKPSFASLIKLVDVLNISSDWLLGISDTQYPS